MDNGQGQEEEEKDRMEGAEINAPPLPDGSRSRRPRKFRDLPPGNRIEDCGGDGYSVSGRKRARLQEGEVDVLKTSGAGDEGVKVSVEGMPMAKVMPSSEGVNERGESSKAQLKVEGVKGGGEASSSSIIAGGGEDATQNGTKRYERKRARRQEEVEVGDILKSAAGYAGAGCSIGSAQSNLKVKITPNLGGDTNKTGKRSMLHQGKVEVKVGGVKRGKVPSSLAPVKDVAQRSGTESSKVAPKEDEAHPCLFIENILDVVFGHFINQPGSREDVAKDVQNIRLVCKTWRDSVTRAYRRESAVATIEEYDMPRTKSLAQFMKTMKRSDLIPVQKFKFWMSAFQRDNLKLFGDFFRLRGPEVVSLEIHISSGEAERLMLSLKNLPDLKMTKLKTLIIKPIYYPVSRVGDTEKNGHGFVSLIGYLLTTATTLQEFELVYPRPLGYTHWKWQIAAMELVGQAFARRIPGTVTKLKLLMCLNEQTLGILAEAGLKLERFELAVPSTLGRRILCEFLEGHAATLKALEISKIGEKGIFVEFPRLDELVQLRLHYGSVVPANTSTTTPLGFAVSFPKLHRLDLAGMNCENAFRALLSSGKKPTQSLKILKMPVLSVASLAPLVKVAAGCFPCITELHIGSTKDTKETMEEVFKYFDNLESLYMSISGHVRNPNWVDSIFSGISEDDCSRIRSEDFGTVNLNEFHRQPSILNLTRLRKLVVRVYGRIRCIHFTDLCAHFIFLEMENLREIELANSDVQFSPRYLNLLRDKLVLRE